MSRQMTQVGFSRQGLDIPTGGDVDRAPGRQLSVAEMQRALRVALSATRTPAADHQSTGDPERADAGATEQPAAVEADHPESQEDRSHQGSVLPCLLYTSPSPRD